MSDQRESRISRGSRRRLHGGRSVVMKAGNALALFQAAVDEEECVPEHHAHARHRSHSHSHSHSHSRASSSCSCSSSSSSSSSLAVSAEVSGEMDPLDAFMLSIDELKKSEDEERKDRKQRQAEMDAETDEAEEHEQKFFNRYLVHQFAADQQIDAKGSAKKKITKEAAKAEAEAEAEVVAVSLDDIEDQDYLAAVIKAKMKQKRDIVPLKHVDHETIEYAAFRKEFFVAPQWIRELPDQHMRGLRTSAEISVSGVRIPPMCRSFDDFGFDSVLLKAIRKQGFELPTPIQCQGVPAALSGRDIIGIARTGSGKTAAFVWPMIVHILAQPPLGPEDGPIGMILSPTRELAAQIYMECKKFCKGHKLTVTPVFGGMNRYEQSQRLQQGCEIVVATPGRLIDMVQTNATNLQRVTIVVLDEADRMFDVGFGPQVRSLLAAVRPDRQTLLFSATFKRRVEQLARDVLIDPVRITVGVAGASAASVEQRVHVLRSDDDKWGWFLQNIHAILQFGTVLVFVASRDTADRLSTRLDKGGFSAAVVHGDKMQHERLEVVRRFKKGAVRILVATDVAARGLDIKQLSTVINYDAARSVDDHVHRIGRTGRAGRRGVAHTLLTQRQAKFAGQLVDHLDRSTIPVPPGLLQLAQRNRKWRRKNAPISASALSHSHSRSPSSSFAMQTAARRGRSGIGSHSRHHRGQVDERGSLHTNRHSDMRAQFQSRFRSASSLSMTTASSPSARPEASARSSVPVSGRKRKSRWS